MISDDNDRRNRIAAGDNNAAGDNDARLPLQMIQQEAVWACQSRHLIALQLAIEWCTASKAQDMNYCCSYEAFWSSLSLKAQEYVAKAHIYVQIVEVIFLP